MHIEKEKNESEELVINGLLLSRLLHCVYLLR